MTTILPILIIVASMFIVLLSCVLLVAAIIIIVKSSNKGAPVKEAEVFFESEATDTEQSASEQECEANGSECDSEAIDGGNTDDGGSCPNIVINNVNMNG